MIIPPGFHFADTAWANRANGSRLVPDTQRVPQRIRLHIADKSMGITPTIVFPGVSVGGDGELINGLHVQPD